MLAEETFHRYAQAAAEERRSFVEAQHNRVLVGRHQGSWALASAVMKRRGFLRSGKRFVENLDAEAEPCSMAVWLEERSYMAG